MCGIVGLFLKDDGLSPQLGGMLSDMLVTMTDRGPEQNSPLGLRRVQAYSPQELRERYANVFAREFLLPGQDAQQLFRSGKSAATIAVERGLPLGLVYQQLAVALLETHAQGGTLTMSQRAEVRVNGRTVAAGAAA